MNPISLVLVVHNEEARIGAFLRNVAPLVHEIVLVNQSSTDRTADIARDILTLYPGRVVYVEEPCRGFSEASNPLAVSLCTQEWVLVLFPDEAMTTEFQADLPALVASDLDAFQIKRSTFIDGHPLIVGEPTIRLIRRSQIRVQPLLHHDPECASSKLGRPSYIALEHIKTSLEQHADNLRYMSIGNGEGVA